jgi:hypothetical protein
MSPITADRQTLRLWLVLSIVGALLCIVGWVRWFHWAQLVGWFR